VVLWNDIEERQLAGSSQVAAQGLVLVVLLIRVFGSSLEAFRWCHANIVMIDLVSHHVDIGGVCCGMATTTMTVLNSSSPNSITMEWCLQGIVVAEVLGSVGGVPWCGSDAGCTMLG